MAVYQTIVNSFIENIHSLTVIFGLLAFAGIYISNRIRGKTNHLDDLLMRMLSASAIPTGLLLLLCAFDTTLLQKIEGLNIYIALAGLALIYVSLKAVFTNNKRN
jgi:hypothetical protein